MFGAMSSVAQSGEGVTVDRSLSLSDREPTRASMFSQRVCAWSGLAMMLPSLIGLLLADLVPPPAPGLTAKELTHQLLAHPTDLRIGLLLTAAAAPAYALLSAGLAVQMKRIEGRYSPLAYAQLGLGVLAVLEILFPIMVLLAAAFRPGRSDALVQLLGDVALLPFVGLWMTTAFQWLALAVVILQDRRPNPIFPRWGAYLSIWAVVAELPSTALFFVHGGPFAWNGIFSWWLALACFGGWTVAVSALLLRAVKRQEAELWPAA